MSEEQLSALLAKLKEDAVLQAKFKSAADLDAAMAIAREAGFDVSKADLLNYQNENQTLELSDAELEACAGGRAGNVTREVKCSDPCSKGEGCSGKWYC